MSEALEDYVRSSELSGYLSEALGNYVSDTYLSEVLGDYISDTYLSSVLEDYMKRSDLDPYLSEAGAVLNSNFSTAFEDYLSVYGGEEIYNAISQYLNP